jgi:hypothetical protein
VKVIEMDIIYYNVWHKVRKCWSQHNQDKRNPWRYSLEEAQKEYDYLIRSFIGNAGAELWEIRILGKDNKPSCEYLPVREERTITVTYEVKVKIHEDNKGGWDLFDSIDDAVKCWSFGESRVGAHHWDTEFCHVAQDPETKRWWLLYV